MMSSYERNRGTLIPYANDMAERLSEDEQIDLDLFKDSQGKWWKILYQDIKTDEIGFCDLEKVGGMIRFHSIHYNGGEDITEVLSDALKKV